MRKEVKISMVGMILKGDVGRFTNAFFIHTPFLIGILASEKKVNAEKPFVRCLLFLLGRAILMGIIQKNSDT